MTAPPHASARCLSVTFRTRHGSERTWISLLPSDDRQALAQIRAVAQVVGPATYKVLPPRREAA